MFNGEVIKGLTPEQQQGSFLQPKKEIADLVEKLGVPVAPRPPWIEVEGRVTAGERILARSEHPDELAGPSGLFKSHMVTADMLTRTKQGSFKESNDVDMGHKLRAMFVGDASLTDIISPDVLQYCELTGNDPGKYLAAHSYSAWSYIPGYNIIMAGDPTISDRYHLLIKPPYEKSYRYYKNEDGDNFTVQISGGDLNINPKSFGAVAEIYKAVNEAIDPEHRAIMEFQVGFDGDAYFLQYHRGRNSTPATHNLTGKRGGNDNRVWTENVLGATPPEGIDLVAFYGFSYIYTSSVSNIKETIRDNNINGSATIFYHKPALMEYLVRRVRAQVLCVTNFSKIDNSHMTASPLFKPPVTIIVPPFQLAAIVRSATRDICTTRLRVVSDGKQGYVEALPLNKDNPQTSNS